MPARKYEREAVAEGLEKARSMHRAAKAVAEGKEPERMDCASFSNTFAPSRGEEAEAARRYYANNVKLYLGSWVIPQLEAALASMDDQELTRDQDYILTQHGKRFRW